MKKLFAVLLLAGVAFFAWRWYGGFRAEREFERFAEAWTHGDRAEASRHGEPEAVRHALDERSLRGMRSGSIIEAFRGTRYEVESKSASPEGDIELRVLETIRFDPPGATTGIGGAMYTNVRHTATLRKTDDGWKVVAFEPVFVDMGELRRGR